MRRSHDRSRALACSMAGALALVPALASHARAESAPPPVVRQVDLLIVVDGSPGAAAARAAFVAGLPAFTTAIGQYYGGDYTSPAIDLHVGVITADRVDHGALRTASVASCAAAPSGDYIQYNGNQWGQTTQNFSGTLSDAIGCLVPATSGPSTVAEPLAAIRSALDGSVPGNSGFVRGDATLAVLVITNQDDCSATGEPMDAFACAAAAWSCTPAIDATPGARTGCVALADPTGLVGIGDVAAFLDSLKASPSLIAFGVVRGPATPVEVIAGPAIAPSCTQGAVVATPGLRLDAVAGRLANPWTASVCEDASPAGFVGAMWAAIYQPDGGDGYYGDCDGGFFHDDSGVGGPAADRERMGCGCATTGPQSGTGIVVALGLMAALRRRRAR